jgi:DNA-3-methyladenine glycosylase
MSFMRRAALQRASCRCVPDAQRVLSRYAAQRRTRRSSSHISLEADSGLAHSSVRMPQLDRFFFQRDPVTCARELIGCELVWKNCAGIIVETEAYAALNDEACHTFARPSARAFVEKHPSGTAYVYFNYGMYWLLNVLVKGGAEDGFVLFRAIEPTRGLDAMHRRRVANRKTENPQLKPTALCSGPGKLAMALGVDGRDGRIPHSTDGRRCHR